MKLAVLATLLLACNGPRSSDALAATVSQGSSAATHDPVVIRFADPGNAGILAYAKREGILKKNLEPVNATIEWVPAAGAFSANFEAMNAGAINAAGGAISPIIGALSHNLKFKIFAISDPGGIRAAGVISPAQSSIRTLKDLVGKRVAVNLAAHGDYVLLKALSDEGIPASEVNRLPIQPPDAAAAFATGKIDAWSTFGVFFATAVRNGAHVLVTEDQIHSDDVGVLAANASVLEANPEAFRLLIKVSEELTLEARKDPEKFQNVFTKQGPTAVSGDELTRVVEETRELPAYRIPTAADRARIANVEAMFFDNHSIDRNIAVDEIVFDVDRAVAAHGR
jgi:sulfonate transport system substrate-binding protein